MPGRVAAGWRASQPAPEAGAAALVIRVLAAQTGVAGAPRFRAIGAVGAFLASEVAHAQY